MLCHKHLLLLFSSPIHCIDFGFLSVLYSFHIQHINNLKEKCPPKKNSIEETTIKKIVAHSGAMTLAERVYTHLDVQILVDAVNKIVGDRENGEEGK